MCPTVNPTSVGGTHTTAQRQETKESPKGGSFSDKTVAFTHTKPVSLESVPRDLKQDTKAQAVLLRSISSARGEATAKNVVKNLNLSSGDLTQSALVQTKEIKTPTLAELHWRNPRPILDETPFTASTFDVDKESARLQKKFPGCTPRLVKEAVEAYAEKRQDNKEVRLLTVDQFAAINLYTARHYTKINKALRTGEGYREWHKVISDMHQGMALLKQNQGLPEAGSKPFLRGQNITHRSPAHPGRYPVGSTMKDPGFMSTTTDKDIAEEFAYGENTELFQYIFGAQGVNIEKLSATEAEAETLFPDSTELEVVFRNYNPETKVFKVILAEKDGVGHPGNSGLADVLLDAPVNRV